MAQLSAAMVGGHPRSADKVRALTMAALPRDRGASSCFLPLASRPERAFGRIVVLSNSRTRGSARSLNDGKHRQFHCVSYVVQRWSRKLIAGENIKAGNTLSVFAILNAMAVAGNRDRVRRIPHPPVCPE